VFINKGVPSFSCRHAHCIADSTHGKKTFKDFIDYWAPDYDISDCFEVDELVLEPEYRYSLIYEGTNGRIYSNDGKTWYDGNDSKI
jgi:hypothetical protein